jgi:hypothetical protein
MGTDVQGRSFLYWFVTPALYIWSRCAGPMAGIYLNLIARQYITSQLGAQDLTVILLRYETLKWVLLSRVYDRMLRQFFICR